LQVVDALAYGDLKARQLFDGDGVTVCLIPPVAGSDLDLVGHFHGGRPNNPKGIFAQT
jgi:hypothetical protein